MTLAGGFDAPPVVNSAADLENAVLEWHNAGIRRSIAELDAFHDWATKESEKWFTFDEWEQFCMDNGLA